MKAMAAMMLSRPPKKYDDTRDAVVTLRG